MPKMKSYTDVNPDTGRTFLAETPFPTAQRMAEYLRANADGNSFKIATGAPSLTIEATDEAYQQAVDAYERDTGTGKYAAKEVNLREPTQRNQRTATAPWEGYDDATVDEVTARVRDLDDAGRAQVLAYEKANKKRSGVIEPLVNWNS